MTEIRWSRNFEKWLKPFDKNMRNKVKGKLNLFLENRHHPSLRYKKVQALKHENPPVYEISIDMSIRITLQEFDDQKRLKIAGAWRKENNAGDRESYRKKDDRI